MPSGTVAPHCYQTDVSQRERTQCTSDSEWRRPIVAQMVIPPRAKYRPKDVSLAPIS